MLSVLATVEVLATLESVPDVQWCWRKWRELAMLESDGNVEGCWQRWRVLAMLRALATLGVLAALDGVGNGGCL